MDLVQTTPVEVRSLDINTFRQQLNQLQADQGLPFDTTHDHVPPANVSGTDLARVVRLINAYTVTFEDGQYAVNLVGGNTNLGDRVNVNQVSVRTSNSAGLVTVSVPDNVWTIPEKERVMRDTRLIPALL